MSLSKLRALKKRVEETREETKEVRKIRAKKKEERSRYKQDPRPNYQKAPRRKNSVDVETWFRDEIERSLKKKVVLPPWTVAQKSLAKKMIETYGAGLTEDAVKYICSNWKKLKKGFKSPPPIPTVNLLWGMRENIFTAVQLGEEASETKDSDEYKGDAGGSSVGW